MPSTDISIEVRLGLFSFMIALGLNGAPGMVTLASSDIVETEFNFSLPPIFSMYLLMIVSAVISEDISLLKTGFSICSPILLKYFTGNNFPL